MEVPTTLENKNFVEKTNTLLTGTDMKRGTGTTLKRSCLHYYTEFLSAEYRKEDLKLQ